MKAVHDDSETVSSEPAETGYKEKVFATSYSQNAGTKSFAENAGAVATAENEGTNNFRENAVTNPLEDADTSDKKVEKPIHQCSECDRSFQYRRNLTMHMKKHKNKRQSKVKVKY